MPAKDTYVNYSPAISGPIAKAVAVTPSDSVDLEFVTRAIYVGTTGNIAAVMPGGNVVTFSNVPVGWHPLRVSRINSTSTTASDIVAGW